MVIVFCVIKLVNQFSDPNVSLVILPAKHVMGQRKRIALPAEVNSISTLLTAHVWLATYPVIVILMGQTASNVILPVLHAVEQLRHNV